MEDWNPDSPDRHSDFCARDPCLAKANLAFCRGSVAFWVWLSSFNKVNLSFESRFSVLDLFEQCLGGSKIMQKL